MTEPTQSRKLADAGSLEIRPVREHELEAVSAVNRAAYAEYAAYMARERIERYLHNAGDVWSRMDVSVLLVAVLEGKIVGSLTYFPPGPSAEAQHWPTGWAGLRLLAVDPAARGLGIGRKLMEASIERARSEGAPAIGLHTTEMMAIALAMYERMGFVRVPELDFPRPTGGGAMAYRYDIAPSG
jgi:ribosomal protein S18 acetylase RimI-like enzyme